MHVGTRGQSIKWCHFQ